MSDLPGADVPYWLATTPPTDHARLAAGITTDVVVLGAGIAGLTTALLLQEAGASVVLLEADRVCAAVTARTTAKVTALQGTIYSTLVSSFDVETAGRYAASQQLAVEEVVRIADRLGIECDLARCEATTYAESDDGMRQVLEEAEAAAAAGLPVDVVDAIDVPWPIRGAVRLREQVRFHPRAYLLGVLDAFLAAGGRVFEQSRVTDVDDGAPATVRTDVGHVTADHVVVTTHLPILDRGMFFAKAHPMRSYAQAIRIAEPVPRGMHLSVDEPTRSLRFQPGADGEEVLILGGEGHKTGQDDDEAQHHRNLAAFAHERFTVRSIDHRWSTQDYIPNDHVPFIGALSRTSRALWTATGFMKWGMTNGTLAGVVLRDLVLGRGHELADLFDPNRLTPRQSAKEAIKENINVAQRFVGDRLRTPEEGAPEDLAPGEGRVLEVDGQRVAVSRGDDGTVAAVSAVCTHMGCIVAWNTAERSWDCPCHGSRFAPDGSVLQGPATTALETRDTS